MPKKIVQKSIKAKQSESGLSKAITVVCVHPKTFATPKRKARNNLAEAENIKELSENKSVIMEKLHQSFPSSESFTFLKVTSGKDPIPASSLPEDDAFGEALLELTDGTDLYVRASCQK